MDGAAPMFVLGSFVLACSARVPRFPGPGESLRADAFTLEAGGKGLNLMLGAHRLGARVDGLLAVGNDPFALVAESALAQAGLPSALLRRYPTTTGSGIGFIDARGENCLAVHPGANEMLSAADISACDSALRRASLVLAQFEIADAPIVEAFAIARAAGIPTLLNPSPFRRPDPALLRDTAILVLNRVEAARLAGREVTATTAPHIAAALLDLGPATVIVTLGAEGAVAARRDGRPLRQPAFPVDAIDTLGAGDAFTAGLAASLLEGRPLADSLRRAAACGALTASRPGVFAALPTRADLDAILRAHPPSG